MDRAFALIGTTVAIAPRPRHPRDVDREMWNRRYATSELIWSASANRFVIEELSDLPPGRALDLAAGEGRNAVWLAERGWRVLAVDFSEVGLAKGRQLAEARQVDVEWLDADLTSYQPEVAAYDLVLVAYLHLRWESLAPILERAAAAVAPGGTFLLVGHDAENLEGGYGGPPEADVLYGPPQISEVIARRLQIEKAVTVERPVQTDAGPKVALDCLVRARSA